jgi:putative MATE family efflux protein
MNSGFEKLSVRRSLFGDRAFYHRVFVIILPMIVQNTLSSVLGLLDNIMVGQIGTLPMSAVAITSQLFFVFYLTLFGALAGAGIYGAQFFGSGNMEGVRNTLRVKFMVGFLLTVAPMLLFFFAGDSIIASFISAGTPEADRAATLSCAHDYLFIMILGLLPFAVTSGYASTLRECGKTALPMKAGMIAMVTNFIFNSLLIFGLFGFPKLGVAGAAIATVLSRFVEAFIVVFFSHRNKKAYGFLQGLYRHLTVPRAFFFQVVVRSAPLLINEFMWSAGQAFSLQCFSHRGIAVIAALNICYTVSEICHQVYITLGSAAQIVIGQELGANRLTDARYSAWRMITLATACCVLTGILLAVCAPFIPLIYNTENEIRQMATGFLLITACCLPLFGFDTTEYFVLRSGGRTVITFLFDSCFSWCVTIPATFLLVDFTNLSIMPIFAVVCGSDFIKCIIGFILVRKGIWVKNLVSQETPPASA